MDFYLRGEVILTKGNGSNLNDSNETIQSNEFNDFHSAYYHGFIFSHKVSKHKKRDKKQGWEKTDSISRDQFLEYTKSVWRVNETLMNENINPHNISIEEADYYSRFVHLYSFLEDIVAFMCREPQKDTLIQIMKMMGRKWIGGIVE